jgi:hypothetical protein
MRESDDNWTATCRQHTVRRCLRSRTSITSVESLGCEVRESAGEAWGCCSLAFGLVVQLIPIVHCPRARRVVPREAWRFDGSLPRYDGLPVPPFGGAFGLDQPPFWPVFWLADARHLRPSHGPFDAEFLRRSFSVRQWFGAGRQLATEVFFGSFETPPGFPFSR